MRLLNIAAALSGALALIMLVLVAHALQLAPPDADRMQLGAFIQLTAAAAGLAIANRDGRLNLIAGAMLPAGLIQRAQRFAHKRSQLRHARACRGNNAHFRLDCARIHQSTAPLTLELWNQRPI